MTRTESTRALIQQKLSNGRKLTKTELAAFVLSSKPAENEKQERKKRKA